MSYSDVPIFIVLGKEKIMRKRYKEFPEISVVILRNLLGIQFPVI